MFIERKEGITDKIVFLKLFLPKNFSRISPLVYIWMISVFMLFIGLMFYKFLLPFAAIGGFMIFVLGTFLYFFKNPLIG